MPFNFLKNSLVGRKALPGVLEEASTLFAAYVWGAANLEADLSAMVEDWHEVGTTGEPAFQNSWVNYGGADATAAFYKDPFGRVHMRGLVKSGTVPAVAFTLPVGYRPPKSEYFATVANSAFGALDVGSSGDIYIRTGSNVWFSINCSFRAA